MYTFSEYQIDRNLSSALVEAGIDCDEISAIVAKTWEIGSWPESPADVLFSEILGGIGNIMGAGMNAMGRGAMNMAGKIGRGVANAGSAMSQGVANAGSAMGQGAQWMGDKYSQGEQAQKINMATNQVNALRKNLASMGFKHPEVNALFDKLTRTLTSAGQRVASNPALRFNQPGIWKTAQPGGAPGQAPAQPGVQGPGAYGLQPQ